MNDCVDGDYIEPSTEAPRTLTAKQRRANQRIVDECMAMLHRMVQREFRKSKKSQISGQL